jgi:hypothetical protein
MCPRLLTNATNLDVTERGTPRPRPARAEPASPATTWRLGPNLQQQAARCGAPYSARHYAGRPKGGRLLSPERGLVGEGHDGQGDTAPKQARQLPPSRTRTLRSRADQAGHFCLYRIAASTRRSYGRHVHSCCDATPPRLTKRRGLRGRCACDPLRAVAGGVAAATASRSARSRAEARLPCYRILRVARAVQRRPAARALVS